MHLLQLKQFQSHGLSPIDLTLDTGSCTTLTGPSGCGKTRLLRSIADLDPHQGEALLAGTPLDQIPPPSWRQQVGLLPAESHWWDEQVKRHFKGPVDALLEALGLPPECMEWQIQHISSGERQRLALVRLLSVTPRVLLLDEPTANLDQKNIARVETLIDRYRQDHDAAILWVSHDPVQRRRIGGTHLAMVDDRLEDEGWS